MWKRHQFPWQFGSAALEVFFSQFLLKLFAKLLKLLEPEVGRFAMVYNFSLVSFYSRCGRWNFLSDAGWDYYHTVFIGMKQFSRSDEESSNSDGFSEILDVNGGLLMD